MRIRSPYLLLMALCWLPSGARAQDLFLECMPTNYCAGVTSNGDFYGGSGRPGGDPFQRRWNVLDGYSAQERVGLRIMSFRCQGDEFCVAVDTRGAIYYGSARLRDEDNRFR